MLRNSQFSTSPFKSPRRACFIFFILTCTGIGSVLAGEAEEIDVIRNLLATTQPEMEVGDIIASPIAGLYQVSVQRGQTLFISSDARYVIPGDLYAAGPGGMVNLGEKRRNDLRVDLIAGMDEDNMIIFAPQGESRATITVFTDVDCPYCRKLHDEIAALNDLGITIRYLAYPRTGLDTPTHFKMSSIWCSADRKTMFTNAKMGGDVPPAECDDPVAEQFEAGIQAGVTGTPSLVFEDGSIVPGYVPAATLSKYLFGDE